MHATPRRRRRTLALAALAFTLIACTAAFVVHRSLACPVVIMPQPLRTLYTESDRVVVARVGATYLVESKENYSQVRTALHVERNVKGKDEGPVVYVQHATWEEEGVEKPGTFKRDERLLVFLERTEEEGGDYEVFDTNYGVKKLTDAELKVYLARIDELRQIVETKTPDKAALAEWLVRCAEEQATRWEGAYELQLSADALASQGEQTEQPAAEAAEAEADTTAATVAAELSVNKHNATVEEYEAAVARARIAAAEAAAPPAMQAKAEAANDGGASAGNTFAVGEVPDIMPDSIGPRLRADRSVVVDPSLAAALGAEQKRRLADALFGAEKIGEGEDSLIQVVKYFGDARFVPFLVAQLRRVEENPPQQAEAWLSAIAHAMQNDEAVQLTSKYIENVTYFEEEEEEKTQETDEAETNEEESAPVDEAAAQREMEAREAAGTERARQKRSEMLKDLLVNVERILASPQVARQ